MKKILMLLLAATLVFTACSKSDEKDKETDDEVKDTVKEEKKSDGGKWSVNEDGSFNVDGYEFDDRDQIVIKGERYADDSEIFTSPTIIGKAKVVLPTDLSNITDAGYAIEEDPEMEIADRYGISSVRLTTGEDYSLVVSVYNVSGKTVPLKDTKVDLLSFSRSNRNDVDIAEDVEFPMGITFSSTMNDVVSKYGEPSSLTVTGLEAYSVNIEYKSEGGYKIDYTFYKGVLQSVTIIN